MRTAGLPESNRTGQRPLPARPAWAAIGRSALTTVHLLARRRIHLPGTHVGWWLHFADGSASWVYRETVVERATPADPAVLVVAFRLRWVRGIGHRMFRLESLLNTPLFVGFPGLVSKLWLAHDAAGVYRGVYQWDGAQSAENYARALWRVLALVCVQGSIRYHVSAGLRRDDLLRRPGLAAPESGADWWRMIDISTPSR